jgi:hypothetical protein
MKTSSAALLATMAAASTPAAWAATLRASASWRSGKSGKSGKSKSSKCTADDVAGYYAECYSCGGIWGLPDSINPVPGCFSFPTHVPTLDGGVFYTNIYMEMNATTLDDNTVWIEGIHEYNYNEDRPEFVDSFDLFVGLLDTNTCRFNFAEQNDHGTWSGYFEDGMIHAVQTEPNIGTGLGSVSNWKCKKIDREAVE